MVSVLGGRIYTRRWRDMAATVVESGALGDSELDRSGAEEPRGEGEEDGAQHTSPAGGHSRLAKLPLSRIKALMKADPDLSLASQESVFIIAKATELFVEMIAKDALVYAQQGKRKTLQRKDLDNAIEAIDEFAFLEGIFLQPIPRYFGLTGHLLIGVEYFSSSKQKTAILFTSVQPGLGDHLNLQDKCGYFQ
uniref:DNA polymerase epsilon subunit 4 n=1 Tax=Astyanax mexicanus TaxID=7994 RepID=A0A3B1JTY5_ASTMX